MVIIDINEARVGDVLAAPVRLGTIEVAPPGLTISQSLINTFKNLGVKSIWIASLDIEYKKLSKINLKKTKSLNNIVKFAKSYSSRINANTDSIITDFDSDLVKHSLNVSTITSMIISDYKLPIPRRRNIISGAMLHDIGKLSVDPLILNKPDRLTKDEFEIVKQHTTYGYDAAVQLQLSSIARDIILQHHENYNGSGYPYGLRKDEISLGAKVVHIADVYEARCSKRVYKDANARQAIKDDMRTQVGTMFDPEVFKHFEKNVPTYFINEVVLLEDTKYLVVGYSEDGLPIFQHIDTGDIFHHDEIVSSDKHVFIVDSIKIQ